MNQLFKRIIAYMLDQYQTVLTILAVVSTIAYLVLIYDLKDHEGDSALIRLSAEQIQLYHQTNLLVSQLVAADDKGIRRQIRTKILENMTRFNDTHSSLVRGVRLVREGSRLVHKPAALSPELRRLYFHEPHDLDRRINGYIAATKSMLSLPDEALTPDNPKVKAVFSKKFDGLSEGLESAVSQYQGESEYRFNTTMDMQNLMYALTLMSLVIVGVFILRPLVFKLRESMGSLKEQKDFSENLINTTQAFIVGLDVEGKIAIFNQFAEENTGWLHEELKGVEFFEQFIPADEREAMLRVFNQMMREGTIFENEIETQMSIRSGEFLRISWHNIAILDPKTQKPSLFLATGVYITQRKHAEQELRKTMGELGKLSDRLQDEVNIAAALQKAMLPNPKIDLPGLQGQAKLQTSTEVGGDYYDYFQVAGHQSILLVGDVSGHGVAAGTMVSAAKAGISSLIHEGISKPSEILRSLNETMLATAHQSLLMTMACIRLDARNGHLTFANAGHVLPYLRRKNDRDWNMIEASGLPLGKSAEADFVSTESEIQIEVGDRLFLFTDGVVEEESPMGEAFGYERLEALLNHYGDAEPEILYEQILTALRLHRGGDSFTDDITMLLVNHTDRVLNPTTSDLEASDIIRVSEDFYRKAEHAIPRISRQFVVLFVEGEFSDLFPRFTHDGICRVLPKHDDLYERLGWDRFLTQHHPGLDGDLHCLTGKTALKRQFQLTHSDDKVFLMDEIMAWLSENNLPDADHSNALVMLLEEMVENSLYAAPRDGQDKAYYLKGEGRELKENEEISVDVTLDNGVLGLMVTDNWGTLSPATFLKHLEHAMQEGIVAGVGGGGLYMMWRMSDYLQIRVHPHRQTQVTVLWDLNKPFEMNANTGFQCLYHSEQEEVMI